MAATAVTPLVDISRNAQLRDHQTLRPFFDQLAAQRHSRNGVLSWARELRTALLKCDNALKASLFSWATASTALEIPPFAFETVIDAFIDVQRFILANEDMAALTRLAQLQEKLLQFSQYGTAYVPTKQRNLPIECATPDWESDISSNHEDQSETNSDSDVDRLEDQPAPVKKRRLDPAEQFQQVDALPIKGRKAAQWNRLLREAPEVWSDKVGWWKETMEQILVSDLAFAPSNPGLVLQSDVLYDAMVLVLREIRHVNIKIYTQSAWRVEVKNSGFASWKHPHIQDLLRKNRIQDSVRLILRRWTPEAVVHSWTLKAVEFYGYPTSGKDIKGSRDLISALLAQPSLIPRVSYPQCVYFTLSLDNFVRTWHHFLGAGLYSFGYNVDARNLRSLYQDLMQDIAKRGKQSRLSDIQDLGLRTIFERTLSFKALKNQVDNHAFRHKPERPDEQVNTRGVPFPKATESLPEGQNPDACYYVHVRHEPMDESLLGCAITFAPEGCRLPLQPPKKSKKRKDGSYTTPRPPPGILHPEDPRLNLRFIEADPVRIKQCGRHLVWIVDEETNEKIDFVLFEAFSEEHLKLMMAYHKDLTKVQPVEMLILIETTRAIFPALARDMKESTDFADRLGLTGCHLYKCFNFTSGIHRDRDRTLGSICAQLFLQAKKWEYAFVRLEYRLCVRSQSNTLWSFDGAKGHCCFQPSTEDLTEEECQEEPYRAYRIRGGADDADTSRTSVGSHASAPARSIEKAQEYAVSRQTSEALDEYWDGDENKKVRGHALIGNPHPPSPVRDKDHAGPNRPISSAGRKLTLPTAQYQILMLSLEKRGAVVEVEVRPGGKNGATVVVDGKDVAVVKEKEALTSLGREELLDDRIVNEFRRHHVGLNPSWMTSQSPNDAHAADTDAGQCIEHLRRKCEWDAESHVRVLDRV
ncbi:hypothetical protein B0H13DRAFT_2542848 [Mycena leptocephala]|nr:hypothetical protein B0H13DRAFT_2542848 [Mycena leptocephala]